MYALICLKPSCTHTHTHTYIDTEWEWSESHCHLKTMKDVRTRTLKQTVKFQIHQMDPFVLYNTACCFASDQQPLKSKLLNIEYPFHNIPSTVTIQYITLWYSGLHILLVPFTEFILSTLISNHSIGVNLTEYERLPQYSEVFRTILWEFFCYVNTLMRTSSHFGSTFKKSFQITPYYYQ